MAWGAERETHSFLCLSLDIPGVYLVSFSSLQKEKTAMELKVLQVLNAQNNLSGKLCNDNSVLITVSHWCLICANQEQES